MIEKSVVPREVILLIKTPPLNLNPAEKEEAMGSGTPQKTFLQTTAGVSAGAEAQRAEVTCHSSLCLHSDRKPVGQSHI